MLARRALLAAGVAALVAAAVAVLGDPGDRPTARADAARAERADAPTRLAHGSPEGTGRTSLGAAPAPAPEAPAPWPTLRDGEILVVPSPEPLPPHGRIQGVLVDAQGQPAAARTLMLVHAAAGHRREATTDERGEFALERVPLGSWRARLIGARPWIPEPVGIDLDGTAEVVRDETAWLPLWVPGPRELCGCVMLDLESLEVPVDESPSAMVTVGLRLSLLREAPGGVDPRPVAEALLYLGRRPWWMRDRERGELRRLVEQLGLRAAVDAMVGDDIPRDVDDDELARLVDQALTEPPYRQGSFCFPGLEPGRYVLRLRIEGSETGRMHRGADSVEIELYVDRPADLADGDLELPAEVLSLNDFFEESLARR